MTYKLRISHTQLIVGVTVSHLTHAGLIQIKCLICYQFDLRHDECVDLLLKHGAKIDVEARMCWPGPHSSNCEERGKYGMKFFYFKAIIQAINYIFNLLPIKFYSCYTTRRKLYRSRPRSTSK